VAITNKDLIEHGLRPGKWIPQALKAANEVLQRSQDRNLALAAAMDFQAQHAYEPVALRASGELNYHVNIEADSELEQRNIESVKTCMDELMRIPHIVSGAIMPDACPTGVGTIPVGGVVASKVIHPGLHSADICCSVALSNFGKADPATLLNATQAATHFGPGGSDKIALPANLLAQVKSNPITGKFSQLAQSHFGTQGDGNHFAYVGRLKSTGDTVLVTHHGSRGFGARVFKQGMQHAIKQTHQVCRDVRKSNVWLELDEFGESYWDALQIIREWTSQSHFAVHDSAAHAMGASVTDRFWNEHNFVFKRDDGLFYHAKGATPAFDNWAADATDLTLIPLNMREPILVARGSNAANGLGFSPHGAGRNVSRSAHKRSKAGQTDAQIFAQETQGIDCRFYCGEIDISELPSAYKNAAAVKAQISQFGLADIVDEVEPYGSIMAGDWEVHAPWRRKKKRR